MPKYCVLENSVRRTPWALNEGGTTVGSEYNLLRNV